jgi:hypothetical protein
MGKGVRAPAVVTGISYMVNENPAKTVTLSNDPSSFLADWQRKLRRKSVTVEPLATDMDR